ncbi:hypothetical protein [Erwinia sp. HR93]|uniref:DUF5862 family protein n=1 Tax=Erwinia sp. HR93 TaxID=3094840 RepID=UPI002ADEAE0F|nr:hypothetical protein [Erwinia sp. HR93]MEA1062696.1 hypothetical protein [Erwinia sp. HR93]
MRELNATEITMASGATVNGAIYGLFEGMATGMAIGGKWGGAGGWGFGALSQLVGLIIPTMMGAAYGFVTGAIFDDKTIGSLLADYRDKFGPGSTANGGGPL